MTFDDRLEASLRQGGFQKIKKTSNGWEGVYQGVRYHDIRFDNEGNLRYREEPARTKKEIIKKPSGKKRGRPAFSPEEKERREKAKSSEGCILKSCEDISQVCLDCQKFNPEVRP